MEGTEDTMPLSVTTPSHRRRPIPSRRTLGGTLPIVPGLAAVLVLAGTLAASPASAQVVVYETLRPMAITSVPMAAGYPGGYVANYSPAGNYAAVTAYSPPVAAGYPVAAGSMATMPFSGYAVTQVANYAVEPVAAPVAVTSYYSAPVAAPVVAAPVMAAPVTTYYAPAVAVPLYRRGLFGGLRPARTAMYIPY